MRRTILQILLLACALAFAPNRVAAQNRHALLIGNQDYGPAVGPLKNPHNDVEIVSRALRQAGFTDVVLLKEQKRRQILSATAEFAARLGESGADAIGFFYYSGHGVSRADNKVNYLIPIDVTDLASKDSWFDTVPLDDILTELKQMAPSASHIVVFDACRSELRLPTKSTVKGFVPVSEKGGMFIAYATAPNDVASDMGNQAGPYAVALAGEIARPGQSHLDLFQNVKEAVNVRTDGRQVPWERNGLLKKVYLNGPPSVTITPSSQSPDTSKATRRYVDPAETQFWEAIKESKTLSEYEAFLHKFPDGPLAELARIRIDNLKKGTVPSNPKLEARLSGEYAALRDWPWLATLRQTKSNSSSYFCQGSIIGNRWVLTAGDCVGGLKRSKEGGSLHGDLGELEIVIGVDDLDKVKEVYRVKRVIMYPGLDTTKFPKDQIGINLGLIELDRDWKGPIVNLSLEEKFDPTDNAAGRAAGFGQIGRGNVGPTNSYRTSSGAAYVAMNRRLLEATLPIVSMKQCIASYGEQRITKAKLCAGFDQGGIDICAGNSGAPLIVKTEKGCAYQVGVVSWGKGCGEPWSYGVYERVSAAADWFKQHVPDLQAVTDGYLTECSSERDSNR